MVTRSCGPRAARRCSFPGTRGAASVPPAAGTSSAGTSAAQPRVPKTLTISVQREQLAFGRLSDQTGGEVEGLANDNLSVRIQNVWFAQAAVSLPSADDGTWRVNTDGTMDVTW